MRALEANFDGLVGPTHNYGGLSYGNVASSNNSARPSNPKQAAQQGLLKMKSLHDLGMLQGVLAPQSRPDLNTLRRLGFTGSDSQVVQKVAKKDPALLASCYSASSMWTANAATISPSSDCPDGRLHFTPANLVNRFHRSIEHDTTGLILRATFANEDHFSHHQALPSSDHFGDEGAANHTRFCQSYGKTGVEFFVYGQHAFNGQAPNPTKYPARQSLEASQAVARLHGLKDEQVVFAQQNPDVIDAGVFHNDVIAVGNGNVSFYHQLAFLNTQKVNHNLQQAMTNMGNGKMQFIEVPDDQVSVQDAVTSYLFNSQLLSLPHLNDGKMGIVVPQECLENIKVSAYLDQLIASDSAIEEILVFDLKQSMSNGGGPACLRLRVVLNEAEQAAVNPACIMSDSLFSGLMAWTEKHYRDTLSESDLADPQLITESHRALDELTQILDLGSVYDFQF
ncbi:N-succinylarginine dihydrolase [Candidatus Njordibacter sp. Uisw_056]|uniref:N-succinylarginine dihydrolase n=1 Tax=Candidatus Njordibacter sp. Uisw_056 TaxID=3230973 RepID=UPI003D4EA3B9